MDASSKKRKRRTTRIGNDGIDPNCKSNDVVSDIIESMNSTQSPSENRILVPYKRLQEYRNREQVSSSTQEPLPNKSKNFVPDKKHPLMMKCQKNLQYLQHNRSIPKPRAHLSGMRPIGKEKSPRKKEPSLLHKKNESQQIVKTTMSKISSKNHDKRKLNPNKNLGKYDQPRNTDIISDKTNSSDSEKDYETFIRSHKSDSSRSNIKAPKKSSKKIKRDHNEEKRDKNKITSFGKTKFSDVETSSTFSNETSTETEETPDFDDTNVCYSSDSDFNMESFKIDNEVIKKSPKKIKRHKKNKSDKNKKITPVKQTKISHHIETSSTFINETLSTDSVETPDVSDNEMTSDLCYSSDSDFNKESFTFDRTAEMYSVKKCQHDSNFSLNLSDSSSAEYIKKHFSCYVKLLRNHILDREVLSDMLLLSEQNNQVANDLNSVPNNSSYSPEVVEIDLESDDDLCVIYDASDKKGTVTDEPEINQSTISSQSRVTPLLISKSKPEFSQPVSPDITLVVPSDGETCNILKNTETKCEEDNDSEFNIQILSVKSIQQNDDSKSEDQSAFDVTKNFQTLPNSSIDLSNSLLEKNLFTAAEKYCKIAALNTNKNDFGENNDENCAKDRLKSHFNKNESNGAPVKLDEILSRLDPKLISTVINNHPDSNSVVSKNSVTSEKENISAIQVCESNLSAESIACDISKINSVSHQNINSSMKSSDKNQIKSRSLLDNVNKGELKQILFAANALPVEERWENINVDNHTNPVNVHSESNNLCLNGDLPSEKSNNDKKPSSEVNLNSLQHAKNHSSVFIPEKILPDKIITDTNWEQLKEALHNVPNSKTLVPNDRLNSASMLNSYPGHSINTDAFVKKESPADELDIFATTSIKELYNPKQESLDKLFTLYQKELKQYNKIISAEKNFSTGLKILEDNQAKKIKHLESSIRNIIKHDPCFYKIAEELKFKKECKAESSNETKPSTSSLYEQDTHHSHTSADFTSAVKNDGQQIMQEVCCNNCEKKAIFKCQGCQKAFYCSSECGMAYWKREHHKNCS